MIIFIIRNDSFQELRHLNLRLEVPGELPYINCCDRSLASLQPDTSDSPEMKTAGIILLLATTCLASDRGRSICIFLSLLYRFTTTTKPYFWEFEIVFTRSMTAPTAFKWLWPRHILHHYSNTQHIISILKIMIILIFQPWSWREVIVGNKGVHTRPRNQWRSTIPGPTPSAVSPHYQSRLLNTARMDSFFAVDVEDGALGGLFSPATDTQEH